MVRTRATASGPAQLPREFVGGIVFDSMRLTDILKSDCVRVPLEATDKRHAIFELVDLLAEKNPVGDKVALREAVWRREMIRTTGIGHGLAIPHGKVAGCKSLCMAVGVTREPIDFGAIDGEPVQLIILLASAADQTGPHIQALAQISRLMTDAEFRNALKRAATSDEFYHLIAAQETVESDQSPVSSGEG